jgi:tetratricopeptide (TPR) repeat protein
MSFEDQEVLSLVKRFESAVKSGSAVYYDVEDLELILDYYLETGSYADMKRSLAIARSIHPMAMVFRIKEVQLDIATHQYAKAEAKIHHLSSLAETNVELLIARATILMQRGEMNAGLLLLDRALENAEDPIEVLHMITDARLNVGNYAGAVDSILKILDLEADEPFEDGSLYQLALCLDFIHDFERGVEIFTSLTNREPYNPLLWYQIGAFQLRLGNENAAKEAFEWSVVADADFGASHFELGRILERNDKIIEALVAYKLSINDDLDSGYIHYRIGLLEHELGSLNEALYHYNRALELEDDIDDVHLERAGLYLELENFEAARKDFERVWRDEAYGAEDVLDYVECLIELDQLDKAVDVLYDALGRFPENIQVKLVLAGYLFAADDFIAAQNVLLESLAEEPATITLFEEYFPELVKIDAISGILAQLNKG